MNAVTWALLLLLVGCLSYAIVFYIGRRSSKWKRRKGRSAELSRPPLRVYKYHAVELKLCENPCESALAIAGKRLLKSEAPSLPLAGCNYKRCMCGYTQYDDRRFTQRREAAAYGLPVAWFGRSREDRRRSSQDRRMSEKSGKKDQG